MPIWLAFTLQAMLVVAAFTVAPRVARRSRHIWATTCILSLAVLLLWPLMRFFPTRPIGLLGAPIVACIELTGLFIPATLLLAIAARHVPRRSDGRAILLLVAMSGVFFVRAGWWMLSPGVPDLGPTRIEGGVCRQTTGYTCVAASMVTMLRAHGIDATETEMARLARIEVNGGATDSRAVWALQQKLAGASLTPAYHALDAEGLLAAPKPLLVQLDWGFFVSHMVPVISASAQEVAIGDPLSGLRSIPFDEFIASWKGNAIVLENRVASGP